jgi:structure-specific recognition protein 1
MEWTFSREDYDRLSQFVSEKKLRVKSKVKANNVRYKDEGSSGSEHDAYLERMKAEGEDRDSEDGKGDFIIYCLQCI